MTHFTITNNNFEIILLLLLSSNLVWSILFWNNGKKKSLEHKIDGFLAKLSLILFIYYILFIKENIPRKHKTFLLGILSIVILLYYFSNKYSSIEWCSTKHIITHSIFHVSIASGSIIAFI
jgi:hypothetical protein